MFDRSRTIDHTEAVLRNHGPGSARLARLDVVTRVTGFVTPRNRRPRLPRTLVAGVGATLAARVRGVEVVEAGAVRRASARADRVSGARFTLPAGKEKVLLARARGGANLRLLLPVPGSRNLRVGSLGSAASAFHALPRVSTLHGVHVQTARAKLCGSALARRAIRAGLARLRLTVKVLPGGARLGRHTLVALAARLRNLRTLTSAALLTRPRAGAHDRPVVVVASAGRLSTADAVGVGRASLASAAVPVLARGAARDARVALAAGVRNHRADFGGIRRAGFARPSVAGQLGVIFFVARAGRRFPSGAHRVSRTGLARVSVPVLARGAIRGARRHLAAGARRTLGAIRACTILDVLVFRARLLQTDIVFIFVRTGNH